MRRGELYRVRRPPGDPRRRRVVAVLSRDALIGSRFSTVICAPVFSRRTGLSSEVPVGIAHGLKHDSAILCDALMSVEKSALRDYVGRLDATAMHALDEALRVALALE